LDSVTEQEKDLPDPPVVDPLLRRRCIGHETKQSSDIGINLRDSTVHRKQHIMTAEAIECVGEIKFIIIIIYY